MALDNRFNGLLTNDNLTIQVSPVVNYRIVDPFLATFAVENLRSILSDILQGILKRIIGRLTIAQIVADPYNLSKLFTKELA